VQDDKKAPHGIVLRLDKETGEFQEKAFSVEPHIDMFFKCLDLKAWNTERIKHEAR
jgi:hypothetical protein